jgi:hypothetical protein
VAAREGKAKLLLLIDREDGLEEAKAQAEERGEEVEEVEREEEGMGSMKPSILWSMAAARTTTRRRRLDLSVRLPQLLRLLGDGLGILLLLLLLRKGGVVWQTSSRSSCVVCVLLCVWWDSVGSRDDVTTTGGAGAWVGQATRHAHAHAGNDYVEHCPSVVAGVWRV